ncbi:MAG: transketolase [Porcincola intestinalis]|uniref:transketolase n=1 Tax=Porcincola intestinalis TaxID=2606632 RepID=UPI0029D738AB|nr:transketolase [Porcincola intestinalis]MCI6237459.1 transketolase [Lachnospiraceae bacterium]MDD6449692.1 transketolase [Lachnospiraceae bacterium]MDY5331513.1 transketolase [Porcincola intestinalis]
MNKEKARDLSLQAYKIRKTLLETIHTVSSGHIGGSMSIAEILSVLYFDEMNIDPKDPHKADRDRLVLSKGHCSPALYSTLALRGFFPVEHLKTFRKIDSDLSGHVEIHVPGVDMSAGSLGQGLSVALGMALYGKCKNYGNHVYCILGDGEIQEGQVWEAAMAAGFYKADSLIAFVDNNKIQLDGHLEEVMSPYPIGEKFEAFGWNVIRVNGHDTAQVGDAVELAKEQKGKPTVIVCDTVKGKGVSVFEDQVRFHGGQPTPEEWETAFKEIDAKIAELEG